MQPRQQPGLACEECRQRKLRCDRGRPCSNCKDTGVTCATNAARKPRGPERGLMKALQTRLTAIEKRIDQGISISQEPESTRRSIQTRCSDEPSLDNQKLDFEMLEQPLTLNGLNYPSPLDRVAGTIDHADDVMVESQMPFPDAPPAWIPTSLPDLSSLYFNANFVTNANAVGSQHHGPLSRRLSERTEDVQNIPLSSNPGPMQSISSTPPDTSFLPELVEADLTQLYFDRVHQFIPMLHQGQFFARTSKVTTSTQHIICLQHAMWTFASSMASQFHTIRSGLYEKTRVMLEYHEHNISECRISLELAQAWALVAMYEVCQVDYQRGWLSAGRFFRLVHFLKLHKLDQPSSAVTMSWVEKEERRRTLWVAYILDGLISLREMSPLTFKAAELSTHLPASESSFQNCQPVQTTSLTSAVNGLNYDKMTSWTKLIVAVTLSNDFFFKQHRRTMEDCLSLGVEYNILSDAESRMQVLQYCAHGDLIDPIAAFASLLGQTTLLHLPTPANDRPAGLTNDVLQSLMACSYYKVHPLTPIPLLICAQGACRDQSIKLAIPTGFDHITAALRKLSPGSILAQDCLARLASQHLNSM